MGSNYNCFIDIRLDGGDIQIDVSDDIQLFSFQSGIGFVAIPYFLSTLTSLYRGEINAAKLDCHGNSHYYSFYSDGTNLLVEHKEYHMESTVGKYQFLLKEYVMAIDTEFQKYLRLLEKEGVLPLENPTFGHPLGDDVLNAYYDFSSSVDR